MRSSSRLPPLNSSTTALSSSSSSSSSFSPSSLSFSYTPSLSLPTYPLFLFLTVISLLLLNVAASPITTSLPKQNRASAHSLRNGTTNSSQTDMFGDQPPRSIAKGAMPPKEWTQQSQGRLVRLRTSTSQYLQVHGGQISGTLSERPLTGIFIFFSHEMYLLIQSFHTKEFICMDHESRLYVSPNITEECYTEEIHLYYNGSPTFKYRFVKYSTENNPLFLGINCRPLLGTTTNNRKLSYRFILDAMGLQDKIKQIEKDLKSGKINLEPAPVCARKSFERVKTRRKLKKKWCRNAENTKKLRKMYSECKVKYKKECRRRRSRNKSRKCVCDMLRGLIKHPKKGKLRCLVDDLTRRLRKKLLGVRTIIRTNVKHVADTFFDSYCEYFKCNETKSKSKKDKHKNIRNRLEDRKNSTSNETVQPKIIIRRYFDFMTQATNRNSSRAGASSSKHSSASSSSSSSSFSLSSSSSLSSTPKFSAGSFPFAVKSPKAASSSGHRLRHHGKNNPSLKKNRSRSRSR